MCQKRLVSQMEGNKWLYLAEVSKEIFKVPFKHFQLTNLAFFHNRQGMHKVDAQGAL